MKMPKCKLCGEPHYGLCPTFAAQPSTDKPARKVLAVKALASTAPVGDGVALTSAAHPPAPKGSRKPPKGISKASLVTEEAPPSVVKLIKAKAKAKKKGKTKKAKAEVPALPTQRRPRGRPLQTEEKQSYENTKPWRKMKISRRTFFRRLAAARHQP